MKKYIFLIACTLLSASLFIGCEDINSKHDIWMQNGEDLHAGKIDSFYIYPGRERVRMKSWVGDYRATQLMVEVGDQKDELWFDLPTENRTDSIVIDIDNLLEGSNLLSFVTFNNDKSVKSIPINQTVSTFGEKYNNLLIGRNTKNIISIGGWMMVTWGARTSSQLLGQEVTYTTYDGDKISRFFPAEETVSEIDDENLPDEGEVSIRSLYLPTETCIDTFYTTPQIVKYPL